MSKKLNPFEPNPSEVYPDPLGIAKRSAIFHGLTDIALAGDMPASRLFSSLPASLERDIRGEMEQEKRNTWADQ
jgi:hypothetical protein